MKGESKLSTRAEKRDVRLHLKSEYLSLLREKERRQKRHKLIDYYNSFYDWQVQFCANTLNYYESCLCAANQIGKTRVGTVIDALHLTGEYPENYVGFRFDFPPLVWCLGYSMEKTRDLIQTEIFGVYNKQEGFAGGLITKDKILTHESAPGVVNAMRTVRVRHASGGTSVVQFWSYTQGQHAFMGDVVDWIQVDEEPINQTIRPQLLTRTINGCAGEGGRIIYTFTPENGITELVSQFRDNASNTQSYMQVGWNQAPHITPEKRERLLAQYPEYQRRMRSEGEPMLGHGRIYDIADDFILCDPFEIPSFFDVIIGLDFGYDHPQAIAKLAIDPDNDIIYVTNTWRASKTSANDAWGATKNWAANIPVAWPADGLQHEKGRDVSIQQKEHYAKAGFQMLFEHASWETGGNSVESGIYQIQDRQRKGLFKVFKGNEQYMQEHRQYHRRATNVEGKSIIVKTNDDILDAVRYAYMMRRFAKKNGEVGKIFIRAKRPAPVRVLGINRAA